MTFAFFVMVEHIFIVECFFAGSAVQLRCCGLKVALSQDLCLTGLVSHNDAFPAEERSVLPLTFEHFLCWVFDRFIEVKERLGPLEEID